MNIAQFVDSVLEQSQLKPPRVATYRLQFQASQFRFADATGIAPYLRDLGISHIYASPILKTRSGSTHGYDVVDPTRINDELGNEAEFAAYLESLRQASLSQIVDIVPNHMSVATAENPWWLDVLMNGRGSPYAKFFDIDWDPVKRELEGRVLLPVLGDLYGNVLESGGLPVEFHEGAFIVRCYGQALPLDPQTWSVILNHELDAWIGTMGNEHGSVLEMQSILTALQYLPSRNETAADRMAERQRERSVIQNRLRRLASEDPSVMSYIDQNLAWINGKPGEPSSFDALDRLLDDQAYRLVHWKAGSDELNYRRFFDVTELAAVCMENPEVFRITHERIIELLAQGDVAGVRIDHIDGLFRPAEYLWRLQWSYLIALGKKRLAEREANPPEQADAWPQIEAEFIQLMHQRIGGPHPSDLFAMPREESSNESALAGKCAETSEAPSLGTSGDRAGEFPLDVVVEKILGLDEPLPPDWPIRGTTGYEFLNLVSGIFIDPGGLRQLVRHYQRFTDASVDLPEIVHDSKRLILGTSMQSEVELLAHRLDRLSHRHRKTRDYTLQALRSALREIIACFPVYRTYICDSAVSERDERVIQHAVSHAMRRNPNTPQLVYQFIRDVLLLRQPEVLNPSGELERELFIGRFQQVTSPVMAKGVEDTAFYRYIPLTSLEEVGGEPLHAVRTVDEFHRQNQERLRQWPQSMLATTTHDTKRSEDVRARLHVLSEIPRQWRESVQRWSRWNRKHRQDVEGQPAPSRNDEWLFYQSLVGIWPLERPDDREWEILRERILLYMEKASHEAKLRTSWINANARYDEAVRDFVRRVMDRKQNRFLDDVESFVRRIARPGLYNSLSQTCLKFLSPGVPDLYQGQESWDFSLVDPDNRRPVDFERNRWLLGEIQALAKEPAGRSELARQLAENPEDSRTKIFLTWILLQHRQEHAISGEWSGDYLPLDVVGNRAEHVCAFAWRAKNVDRNRFTIVLAPRLLYALTEPKEGDDRHHLNAPVGAIWEDTAVRLDGLPITSVTQAFTRATSPVVGGRLQLADALADFPIGLLTAN